MKHYALIILFSLGLLFACKQNPPQKGIVNVYAAANKFPATLHPTMNLGIPLMEFLYPALTTTDENGEHTPLLLETLPVTSKQGDTLYLRLREGIQWENGERFTEEDLVFSIKLLCTPILSRPELVAYMDNILSIDAGDPKDRKISLHTVPNAGNLYLTDYMLPLQQTVWDPDHILDNYTLEMLRDKDKLSADSLFMPWAQRFIRYGTYEAFDAGENFVSGLGAYKLLAWNKDEYLLLGKKTAYWGTDKALPSVLDAGADSIKFLKIDPLQGLKDRQIDVATEISPTIVAQLQEDSLAAGLFESYLSAGNLYAFIAFNLKPDPGKRQPIFIDAQTRSAIAHLIPLDSIIARRYGNLDHALKIHSAVSPRLEEFNGSLSPIPYDPSTAQNLLSTAGWKDTDNNGILDKNLKGKKIQFSFSLMYRSPNTSYEIVAQYMKTELAKTGIECMLQPLDEKLYNERLKKHDFDAIIQVFNFQFPLVDYKQAWHSEAWQDGYNFSGFGTPETDRLIDSIAAELDLAKRARLSRKMQAIIREEMPVVFLFSPKTGAVVSKRFANEKIYPQPPYVKVNELRLD